MLRKETKIFENDFDAATANDLASSSLDLANVFYEDTGVENNEYAYDANGNQITKTAESKTEINTYDGLNQLIGFTDGETTASYKYNADGLRTSKTVDGKTINHIWDGSKQIIVDMDDSDWYSAEVYVRGTNLLAKFSKQSGNVKTDYQYYTQNAHGDVVNLTDSTGAITKSYKYDAFGVEQNIDDADTNAFRYCGEYFDAETGTIYLRARYYNPTIGRFISRDSYAGEINDPLSLNFYTYCENNPIYGIDPNGHFKLPNWAKVAIGAAATVAAVAITGGAAAPILLSVASSVVIGAGTEAVSHRLSTGSWEGAGTAAAQGAVDGFMWGGIFAAAGTTYNVAKTAAKTASTAAKNTASIGKASTSLANYDPEFAAQQLLKGGKTTESALKSFVPKGTPNTFKPSSTIKNGFKYNFKVNGKKVQVKWHSTDLNAAKLYPGSNSGSGWTAQIKVGRKYLTQGGQFVKQNKSNWAHIPVIRK